MTNSLFQTNRDYWLPLLRLIAQLPEGQAHREHIFQKFFEIHQAEIPPDHFKAKQNGEIHWHNKVAWARYELVKMGLLDAPERAIWRITEAGRNWLAANPEALYIPSSQRLPKADQGQSSRRNTANRANHVPAGITLEMLQQTRKYMPAEEFRQSWGALYEQLLAEERAKAITPINTKELMGIVLEQVQCVQNFLQGTSNDTPKSEELCDWIHFCYALKLHREVAALWQFVHPDDVNDWQYERTKRLATVCRTRLDR